MIQYAGAEKTGGEYPKDATTWLNEDLAKLIEMSELPCTKDNLLRFIIAGRSYLTQIRIVAEELTEEQFNYYHNKFTEIKDKYGEKICGEDEKTI